MIILHAVRPRQPVKEHRAPDPKRRRLIDRAAPYRHMRRMDRVSSNLIDLLLLQFEQLVIGGIIDIPFEVV